MLDIKGITLEEVANKFNVSRQTLGFDTCLDVDSACKPRILSTFELVVNSIIGLLIMKPGQYPSIPDLGIDIEQYLFEYSDDPKIPLIIQSSLEDQCNRLGWSGVSTYVTVDEDQGIPVIVVQISGFEYYTAKTVKRNAIIGITHDKLNKLYVNKKYM